MPKLNRAREDFFNVLTHQAGTILSAAAASILIIIVVLNGSVIEIMATSIVGFIPVLLYPAYTNYHAFSSLKYKRILQQIDHLCVYLTPFGTYLFWPEAPFSFFNFYLI